jgi:coiled-coil domain-containing protein 130
MKCHLCPNWIVIHTDPKNSQYLVIEGARKKVEEWSAKDSETFEFKDEEHAEKLLTNPIFKLEAQVKDQRSAQDELPFLSQLQQLNQKHWKDTETVSRKLRLKFRVKSKIIVGRKKANIKKSRKSNL